MNKCVFSIVIIIFSTFYLSAQQKKYREIWLFAAKADDASFITQKSALTDAAGLNERDIRVHEVIGFKAHQAEFKKYNASAQKFTFILFGKDGGEKLRSNEFVSKEKLYRTVDDMPMRKDEVKRKL